jgi:hypothetical protein
MAWRPNNYLLGGELENTTPGKVTGWMKFAGMKEKVTFDLEGDFHRDIRGAMIRLSGKYRGSEAEAVSEMEGFALHHTGKAGDITAGLPPVDLLDRPYVEIYSDQNGRVVLELEPEQVQVIGTPIPPEQAMPISREQQWENLIGFAVSCAGSIAEAPPAPEDNKTEHPPRGMKHL